MWGGLTVLRELRNIFPQAVGDLGKLTTATAASFTGAVVEEESGDGGGSEQAQNPTNNPNTWGRPLSRPERVYYTGLW